MQSSALRILLVEDFEPFRKLIRSILLDKSGLQIIAEASDGLDAVQKASELNPDLILLDIGLPTLNGFDAARLIRRLSPHPKILFVSQEFSPEIVEEALSLGDCGYVLKTKLASDLPAAIAAVLHGKTFVSSE
jgi:DNA-binding NarL/FixJ family response regulator